MKLVPSAQSNQDGSFVLPAVSKSGDTIIASASGYAAQYVPLPSADLKNNNLSIALKKGASIHGLVCNRSGNPGIAGEIQIFNYPDNTFTYRIYTDNTGHYKIQNLPEENFYVRYSHIQAGTSIYQSSLRQIQIKAGEDYLVNLGNVPVNETKNLSISTVAMDTNNKPMPNARIRLVDAETHGPMGTRFEEGTIADSNGKFSFYDVPPGEYLLNYYNPEKDSNSGPFPTPSATVKITIGDEKAATIQPAKAQNIPSSQSSSVTSPTETIPAIDSCLLTGTVVDKDTGSPVANADVELYNEPAPQNLVTQTDQKGRFTYPKLSPGTYHILVVADQYQIHQSQTYDEKDNQISLGSNAHEKEIKIQLLKGNQANITVLSPDGKPVSGAKVSYGIYKGSKKEISLLSDTDGKVSFQNLSHKPIQVNVQKDGFGPAISELFIPGSPSNPKEIQVKLIAPVTIKGRVVTKNETPVQDVPVFIYSQPENKTTKTNAAGEYEFNGLGTKILSVSIRSDEINQYFTKKGKNFFNFGSGEQGGNVTQVAFGFKDGEVRTMPDFVIDYIEPSVTHKLQIMDKNKNPIANAKIDIQILPVNETYVAAPSVSSVHYSDENGIAVIKDTPSSADCAIDVKANGFIPLDSRGNIFELTTKKETTQIRLERTCSISGFVVEKDTLKPVKNALVYMTNARNGLDSGYNAITNALGMYEIHGLIPLPYQIHTVAKEFVTSTTNTFNVPSETNLSGVNFALDKGHSIQGIIRNVTGEPIEKAELSFLSKNKIIQYNSLNSPQDTSPGSYTFPESTSTGDGSFHVSGVTSNGDILIAQANGYAPQMMPLSQDIIKRGQLTITMKSDSKIYGTVCDEAGNPIDHCELNAVDTIRNMFKYKTFSDKDGNFLFSNLPNGAIKILTENPYRMFKTVFLKNGDTPFVSLGNTGKQVSIEGTLFDKNNHPLPHNRVSISDHYHDMGNTLIIVESDDQGKYHFYDIVEGDYFITPRISNDRSLMRTRRSIHVVNGKTTQMDIHLNPSALSLQFFNQETNAGIEGVHFMPADTKSIIETAGGASNKDGVLAFANNTTGSFHFIAMHPGYYAKPFKIEAPDIVEDSTIEVAVAMKPTTAKLIAHVDSPDIDQLNGYGGIFRAIQGNSQFFLTAKVIDSKKRLLEITGFPEGEMLVYLQPFMVRDSRNMPMSFPKSFKPVERETATLDFPLINVEQICFHFIMPDSENLPHGIQIDIPDIENSGKIQPDYRNWDSSVNQNIPTGKHLVRIVIPGYKPIECTPSEMPRNVWDQIEINLANYK